MSFQKSSDYSASINPMIAAYSMKRIAFNARTAEYKVLACILAVREYSNCKTKQNFLGVRITGYHKKKKKTYIQF